MYKKLLDDLVSSAVGELIGDLKDVITYQSFTSAGYNPDTRRNETVFADLTGVDASCYKFRADEKDTTVNVVTDERCLVPSKHIPGITPKETDRIIKVDGSVWEVFRVRGVPGQSLWILFIRKIKA